MCVCVYMRTNSYVCVCMNVDFFVAAYENLSVHVYSDKNKTIDCRLPGYVSLSLGLDVVGGGSESKTLMVVVDIYAWLR